MDVLIAKYLASLVSSKSKRTIATYKNVLARFGEFHKSSRREGLWNTVLEDLVTYLHNAGYKPASIHTTCAATGEFFRWLKSHGAKMPEIIKPNLPRIPRRNNDALGMDQILRALSEHKSKMQPDQFCAICVMLFTGVRISELISLRKADIHKQTDGTVILRVVDGKGSKDRDLPIPKRLRSILSQYLGAMRIKKSEWLFPSRNILRKTHVSKESATLWVRRFAKLSGLKITPHTLRRTFGTELYRKNVHPFTIQKLLGHSDPKTTLLYVKSDVGFMRKDVEDL